MKHEEIKARLKAQLQPKKNGNLAKFATSLGMNWNKSAYFMELNYYLSEDGNTILAYYKGQIRYSYNSIDQFLDCHGFSSKQEAIVEFNLPQ